jgi:hypothetical protein
VDATAPGDEDEISGSASRLDTLLPLLRNTLLIGLVVVAVIAALATLGLDIGPSSPGSGWSESPLALARRAWCATSFRASSS